MMNWLSLFMCFIFHRHVYQPMYSVRVWTVNAKGFRGRKKKTVRQEIQFKCACCNRPTNWMSIKRREEFMTANNVTWSNQSWRPRLLQRESQKQNLN